MLDFHTLAMSAPDEAVDARADVEEARGVDLCRQVLPGRERRQAGADGPRDASGQRNPHTSFKSRLALVSPEPGTMPTSSVFPATTTSIPLLATLMAAWLRPT